MDGRRGPRLGRLGVVLALAAVAVAGTVATAWAFTHDYRGTVDEQANARVRFTLVQRQGHGEFVKPFRARNIRLTCSLGPSHIVIEHVGIRRIPVTDDKFRATRNGSDVGIAVGGHLAAGGRAHGRLDVTEQAAECDSGLLHWHAHRT